VRKTPLKRKTGLRQSGVLKSGNTPLARTKLKAESKTHTAGRKAFHDAVFARWGTRCYFCNRDATAAMHVIDRKRLGGAQRYGVPEANGRPGCDGCHQRQTDRIIDFPLSVRQTAVVALNAIGRVQLPYPTDV